MSVNWNTKIATVISYGDQTRKLSGVNRVVYTTDTEYRPINTIYRFNVGYVVRAQRFKFTLVILANSPDVPFIRTLLDTMQDFDMEIRSAYLPYKNEQLPMKNEILHTCVLRSERVAFEVEGDAPVLEFEGLALRKSVKDSEGNMVYEVGSGAPSADSKTDPFAWLNSGGGA